MTRRLIVVAVLICCSGAAYAQKKNPYAKVSPDVRLDAIRHAQVWERTDIASMDMKAGPQDVKGWAPEATVTCEYVDKKVSSTPKFYCSIPPDDEIKVKFGQDNGEVYGEVAATRLLWALGFGADRMYPVKVICHNCPENAVRNGKPVPGVRTFDPAAIERKMPGDTIEISEDSGWGWTELNFVDPAVGGAPKAHRDALALLAAMIQHTDSKPTQQRLICRDRLMGLPADPTGKCAHAFMELNDVGRTFGKANAFNRDMPGSVSLKAWTAMRVWKDPAKCVADIPKSMTGTLDSPVISEDGRKFLADLLMQLTDQQLRDLFEVSRFTKRDPASTIDAWVNAFKQKRDEIVNASCALDRPRPPKSSASAARQ
jgi:hypothetical protein